jgi:hypothetical protein
MLNLVIKILAIILMIPILIFSIGLSVIWNGYLITDYILVRLRRKWKAGIKEAKKTDGPK